MESYIRRMCFMEQWHLASSGSWHCCSLIRCHSMHAMRPGILLRLDWCVHLLSVWAGRQAKFSVWRMFLLRTARLWCVPVPFRVWVIILPMLGVRLLPRQVAHLQLSVPHAPLGHITAWLVSNHQTLRRRFLYLRNARVNLWSAWRVVDRKSAVVVVPRMLLSQTTTSCEDPHAAVLDLRRLGLYAMWSWILLWLNRCVLVECERVLEELHLHKRVCAVSVCSVAPRVLVISPQGLRLVPMSPLWEWLNACTVVSDRDLSTVQSVCVWRLAYQ